MAKVAVIITHSGNANMFPWPEKLKRERLNGVSATLSQVRYLKCGVEEIGVRVKSGWVGGEGWCVGWDSDRGVEQFNVI